jgi:hypothetical protein
MGFAPQHDWTYLEGLVQPYDAASLAAMTPAERFCVYADLYNSLWAGRQRVQGDWAKLDEVRWQEKLAQRRRMVEAFTKLDRLRG